MAIKPPQHSVDATPVFIAPMDPAWDRERIDREIAEHYKEKASDHPVRRYWRGETRYDLDAPFCVDGADLTIKDYLTADATRWTLRRLSVDERAAYYDLASSGSIQAAAFAVRWGLRKCDAFDLTRTADGALSEASMQQIVDAGDACKKDGGMELLISLGSAIGNVSQGITVAEGKR